MYNPNGGGFIVADENSKDNVMKCFSENRKKEVEKMTVKVDDESNYLCDGIYELDDDIEVIKCEQSDTGVYGKGVKEFTKKHKSWVMASAYETEFTFLLSRKPDKFKGKSLGSGYNYGSTNILVPKSKKRILILAEND